MLQPVEIWAENWPAVRIFARLGTQWRVGMGGATGLDYTAVLAVIDRMAPEASRDEREDIFDAVQIMEREALDVMAENRKADTRE